MRNKSLATFHELLVPQTLVVLDIDSTLVQTHKRNQTILHQYAREISGQNPSLSLALLESVCYPLEYGYYGLVNRATAKIDESQQKEIHQYWRQHFFSNHFLSNDIPHDGALEFVECLHQKRIPHVYLTGRPRPLMWEGTLQSLQALGFSLNADQVFLKPQATDVDELFKSEKMRDFKKDFKQILFIDNEPKVLNQIDRDHPDVSLVFVDTCHSPNVFPPASAFKIKDFREIVKLLRK